jgi:two-component system, chemotaxis family, sensor histidine kinase and response regulator PixL
MTIDQNIHEQGYQYFLQEAPELLQILEQGLLNFRKDPSLNKINTLMRATHTLKGAAASVRLETIATVAHSLEDVFKALCQPDVVIDAEAEALLFEGFECLRLPLTAEFNGEPINHAEILDRTAVIFAQLQDKFGDYFGQETHLPTSTELGFDITKSIFEIGVTQRLERLAAILEEGQPTEITIALRTQAEIFLGLAESLNLPGFGAIAQATLTALNQCPDQAMLIAQQSLEDFWAAQAAVSAGDRTQGGQPSERLQQFVSLPDPSLSDPSLFDPNLFDPNLSDPSLSDSVFDITHLLADMTQAIDSDQSSISAENSENLESSGQSFLESVWGGQGIAAQQHRSDSDRVEHTTAAESNFSLQNTENVIHAVPQSQSIPPRGASNYHPDKVSPAQTLRVNIEHLDQLNYLIGELLTDQNRQSLQGEQVQSAIATLNDRLKQHQQLLNQLQNQSPERQRVGKGKRGKAQKKQKQQTSSTQSPNSKLPNQFDALELDQYSETQLIVQSILDDVVQLSEAIDAINLFTRQFSQTQDKRRRLLTSAQEALMEARMMPLNRVLDRVPVVLQQLETLHNKPVALEIRGSDILVDKLVAEKLYAPLLHLIRNAFDHGVESVDIRQQHGKPERGQLEIYAYRQGKYLMIEVRDDGKGIDFEQVRKRAIERQLISSKQAESLSQEQLIDLLFESGFSTTDQVSDLSGRGIGLNIVRSQLQSLQGTVTVVSEPGQGTVFTLEVPLSMSIAKLLLCQANSQTYALFANAIEQVLIPQPEQIELRDSGKVLRWGEGVDERWVPVLPLAKVLSYHSVISQPPIPPSNTSQQPGQIILMRHQGGLLGLEVDQLFEEQELVIRLLGSLISAPSYIYGASILADGRLALVIDAVTLMQNVLAKPINSRADRGWANSSSSLLLSSPTQRQLSPQRSSLPMPGLGKEEFRSDGKQWILIADDSITTRQTLSLTLQKAGYQVLQAKNGYEALEQLEFYPNIQAVICDVEMPRMNGFEFLRHHQHDPAIADIPVVMLTSRSGEKHRLLAEELGAAAYVTKPYLEQKLLAIVARILEMHNLASVSGQELR